jgi:hypothetical protein
MTALVVLGVLGLTALFLAGLLTYLYRWRVRKRLFPQLPRLWKRDRSRFFISSALFVMSLLAFMVVSLATGPSMPEPPKKLAAKKQQGPSFDGAPPPPMPKPAPAQPPEPAPSAVQPGPQPAIPAPIKEVDQAGLPAKQPQTAQSSASPAQKAPETQAPGSSPEPVKEQPSLQATQEPKAAQTSRAEKVKPKTVAPSEKAAPDKTLEAPPIAAEPQAQPAPAKEQAKAVEKAEPTKPKQEKQAVKPPKSKAQAKPTAKKTAKAKAPAKAKPESKAFTVCVASFKDRESAQRQAKRLANKGLKGKIVKAKIKGKGVWYRVCLGEFASTKQATAKAKAWRDNDLVKTPFVVRLR